MVPVPLAGACQLKVLDVNVDKPLFVCVTVALDPPHEMYLVRLGVDVKLPLRWLEELHAALLHEDMMKPRKDPEVRLSSTAAHG